MQRNHNRQVVFGCDDDFEYYREDLVLFTKEVDSKIYSYYLMTNHVHLIVDPGDTPESLSLLMKRVAGWQTRYVRKAKGSPDTNSFYKIPGKPKAPPPRISHE